MTRPSSDSAHAKPIAKSGEPYVLDRQVGFILRQVSQRHAAIFADGIDGQLTPTQWAALSKLAETGPCSQNQLGRLTAMDVATIKGVIDRLTLRGLTKTSADPDDARRRLVTLTRAGLKVVEKTCAQAVAVTEATLAPLSVKERQTLLTLLTKLL
jgi:DNA-binding MarR family transcriptional regulator